MEQMRACKANAMWLLPIIGVAVPIAVKLMRRAAEERGFGVSKEEMLLEESNVDLQHAMHTALKYVPGTPVEVELEEEHGMPIWQVEIVPRSGGPVREVLIDARTGDLLQMKADFEER